MIISYTKRGRGAGRSLVHARRRQLIRSRFEPSGSRFRLDLLFSPPVQAVSFDSAYNQPDSPKPAAPAAESRVREYLANERTYLAWMRTAISMMGFGVVIARIRVFQPPLAPGPGTTWLLGLVFSIVGLVTVFLSTQHYMVIRRDISDDSYEPTGRWIILFSLIVALMGAGIIYYVFSYPPTPGENAPV